MNKGHAIIWTNADLIHWCIYVALGGDEFMEIPSCEIINNWRNDHSKTNENNYVWFFNGI